jgi:hypothetical protein
MGETTLTGETGDRQAIHALVDRCGPALSRLLDVLDQPN